jgi:hypothetical protein
MDLKEMILRIRLLANDILDFSMGSYFGIKADNRDVRNLWKEYEELRDQINGNFSDIQDELPEISIPDPYIADKDSFYLEGTPIFKPEHFTIIRLAVEKMLQAAVMKNRDQASGSHVSAI